MRQRIKNWVVDQEQGQSLVEFAFILPVLLLLVLGTIDLGMGFKTYIGLTNAAREGVRWISINPDDQAGALLRVRAEANRVGLTLGDLSADGYTVTFTPDQSSYDAGDEVTVNIEYRYELLFGAITGIPEVPFAASSTMVVLYDD
jgi:Flp pilus assembly protein TadG